MSCKLQAASCKLQAASCKLQAASCKLQAASCKLQAASCKQIQQRRLKGGFVYWGALHFPGLLDELFLPRPGFFHNLQVNPLLLLEAGVADEIRKRPFQFW
ncbi:hypothetical protein [Pseudomonas petrae]|uniref:hypothetical protein n=1 Tax=Pseudomonas petrae TaxID=2912190 RepID=UPI001F485C93|nr:hypothetical protein [Pseudomonas petrae]MCF7534881.1 hypothetical protein [Pseudomonas petrae]